MNTRDHDMGWEKERAIRVTFVIIWTETNAPILS